MTCPMFVLDLSVECLGNDAFQDDIFSPDKVSCEIIFRVQDERDVVCTLVLCENPVID